jgi:hypothetical protein
MGNDASLFMRLNKVEESKIYIANDFVLDVAGWGDVSCRHGKTVDIYDVPNISENLLFVSQLTHTRKILKIWLDQFYVCELKNGKSIVASELLETMTNLYKFCDST